MLPTDGWVINGSYCRQRSHKILSIHNLQFTLQKIHQIIFDTWHELYAQKFGYQNNQMYFLIFKLVSRNVPHIERKYLPRTGREKPCYIRYYIWYWKLEKCWRTLMLINKSSVTQNMFFMFKCTASWCQPHPYLGGDLEILAKF